MTNEKKKIAVIASRLKVQNSMSIEAEKWIDKYMKLGYEVHLIAGKFGEPVETPNLEIPEMDYKHSEVRGVKRILFGNKLEKAGMKAAQILLDNLVRRIKPKLKEYITKNKINILSVENILTDFANPALTIALKRVISELSIPTIHRCHKFYWDDKYFLTENNITKIFGKTPEDRKNIVYVTNSTAAKDNLFNKTGIRSVVIPNTIDFETIKDLDFYNNTFREDLGIKKDQLIFLQPTKISRKKSIEKSIKLVHEINEVTKKDNVLLITGPPTYFRGTYFEEIVRRAKKFNVNVILIHDSIFLDRHQNKEKKFYSIWDAYANADIVTYPSTSGGFGNPIIEALAHKKPVLVNRYDNVQDIIDKGFELLLIDNKLTNEVISDTYELLADPNKMKKTTEYNFNLLKKYYSSDILDDNLIPVLNKFEHEDFFTRVWKKIGMVKDKNPNNNKKYYNTSSGNNDRFGNKGNKMYKRKMDKKTDTMKNKKGGYKEPSKK